MVKRRLGRHYRACSWDLVSRGSPLFSRLLHVVPLGPCASMAIRRHGRERTTASTLPAGRRSPSSPPAARLPDRQLLVRSPPRAGGWGPALHSGSPIRWVVGRLTPSPTGRSLPAEQLHVQVRTWMIGSALPCPAAVLAELHINCLYIS
ncbi:hypothetical protein BDA96_08G161400 [Sorghum bicolor]|uniref:Uncharacterized protein n=1 Tax=Sorghum bicolor TaxID=4558 RepID=A0A921QIG0_SORBI|nr:hypothetical protein BDA96_08G161400 [Sorghum bicolor]